MSTQAIHTLTPGFAQNRLSNFYFSFLLLPGPKREAIETIYAFCRHSDDIVDEGHNVAEKRKRLLQWKEEMVKGFAGKSRYSMLNRLAEIIRIFNIPEVHFHELLNGMKMDLVKNRYETFEELEQYCYRVASTVGLICAEVFGYNKEQTKQYAKNLGIALQLTNILRDIKADARAGRIYLPLEDLRRFGYSEAELLRGEYNDRFVALMKHQCDRARSYFRQAKKHLAEEDKPLFTAARVMGNIYYLLLRRIERVGYNVFGKRIRLSKPVKLMIALLLRLRARFPRNFHRYIRTELPA
ncbi:MAG: presqualene diphosphate synthase HpnD [Ignavibacteria bacterium]|nr:presqualene diphosphate synthase HpnD [Ignavibacteria bacterium]